MTVGVTIVWNLDVSILCLAIKALIVQNTSNFENEDNEC